MKILIADDEVFQHVEIHDAVERVCGEGAENSYFYAKNAAEALAVCNENEIDVAFLDINMPGKNGIALASELKEKHPGVNIVMVTAYGEYALDALRLFVSAYLMKPVLDEDVRAALANLRNPVTRREEKDARLRARCFGSFEAYVGDQPLRFSRSKAKEMLAYLVCLRGAFATNGEICLALFEESGNPQKNLSYLRKIAASLKDALEERGLGDALLHRRSAYALNTAEVDCDYWNYLDGAGNEIFYGEFMNQYSWAEKYIYQLEQIKKRK